MILLLLAIPLIGAVLILMSAGRPNQRELVTLATAASLFAVVVSLVSGVFNGERPAVSLVEVLPGLDIRFGLGKTRNINQQDDPGGQQGQEDKDNIDTEKFA